jgi:CheY-like chemotaxis protein/DNA-binding XRE family transcriptional regulator
MQAIDVKSLLGAEVRRRRSSLGISQEELGERAALHRTYVSDVEAGKRNLSLESLERLARALGVSLSSVFDAVEARSGMWIPNGTQSDIGIAQILLVEDDPKDVELTLGAFRQAKLANPIRVALNGAEALELISAGVVFPDIVLLDLHLPKVSGLEVLKRLKGDERTQNIPVIVLTVSRKGEDFRVARELGADSYITKPLEFENFSLVMPRLRFRWALLESGNEV